MNKQLKQYVEEKYYPIYETFDGGHNTKHINGVIMRSFQIKEECNFTDLNDDIIYVCAALHDIGMMVERKNHAVHSRKLVLKDKNLLNFFSKEEVDVIATAVREHSTSLNKEPHTIYGKIVADADKDDDIDFSLLRAYEFSKNRHPDEDKEILFNQIYEHLNLKFGDEGLVKFWIDSKSHTNFVDTMHTLATNHDLFLSRMSSAEASSEQIKAKQLVKRPNNI